MRQPVHPYTRPLLQHHHSSIISSLNTHRSFLPVSVSTNNFSGSFGGAGSAFGGAGSAFWGAGDSAFRGLGVLSCFARFLFLSFPCSMRQVSRRHTEVIWSLVQCLGGFRGAGDSAFRGFEARSCFARFLFLSFPCSMRQVSRRHTEVLRSFLQCLGGFRGSRWSREFFVLASVTRNVLDAARHTYMRSPEN
jgi:hypothetical protein